MNVVCSVDGCEKPARKRGWCFMHYERQKRTGSLDLARPSLRDRVMAKVVKTDDCWFWTGYLNPNGYGMVYCGRPGRRMRNAYAVVYELHRGPVPPGLDLDHLCRVRACVNPAHLEPVTHRENVLRGVSVVAAHAAQTHCKHGHEFTPENTYVWSGKGHRMRQCRECIRNRDRRRSLRRRAA